MSANHNARGGFKFMSCATTCYWYSY